LLGRLRGVVPVPQILDCGGDERLSWSLTAAVPGTPFDELCPWPAPDGPRDIAREAARQLPFTDHGVLDAAAGRLTELGDPSDDDGDVLLHGDFNLGNVLVRDGQVSALIDFEFARLGPPDLELISVIRALDMETRLGVPRPPLLAWLAEDYPGLFAAPDLDRRLWRYAIAYTIRHIIFWPPDRAEADGLDPGHPLHTLRRLIDAPLPLPAAGISGYRPQRFAPLTACALGWYREGRRQDCVTGAGGCRA
jgi:phosphotransferase family enzyme